MIHTVLPGETLRGIAAMHGTGPDLLAAWNGTAEPLTGQELLVLQALSVLLQSEAKVTPQQYVKWHPGGSLGHLRENER